VRFSSAFSLLRPRCFRKSINSGLHSPRASALNAPIAELSNGPERLLFVCLLSGPPEKALAARRTLFKDPGTSFPGFMRMPRSTTCGMAERQTKRTLGTQLCGGRMGCLLLEHRDRASCATRLMPDQRG
jgi:hypothetical protein